MGSCGSVGVAGLTLGGGFGLLSRKLGVAADNLLRVEIVTADGEIVAADDTLHPDLFSASRGGGGGTFGIATSFTFRAHPIHDVATYKLVWSWEDARQVIGAWQSWAPHAPDELTSQLVLSGTSSRTVTSSGVFIGSLARRRKWLSNSLSRATNHCLRQRMRTLYPRWPLTSPVTNTRSAGLKPRKSVSTL